MRGFIVFLIGLSILASCTSTDQVDLPITERPIRVTATTSIVADLVHAVGGTEVVVESLMGPGVDPHLYKASARDVSKMKEADLIVYNGLHLEGKMGDVFEGMQEDEISIIAVAEVSILDSLLISSELFQGNHDPHIWFDPLLWAKAGYAIATALGTLDPNRQTIFTSGAATYEEKLMELDAYVAQKASEVPEAKRVLITSHDAFGYFGKAYGFEVEGLQGISTALESGAGDVQGLAALVVEREIPAIFVESSISPRGIEAVQEAVKAKGFEVRVGGTLYGDALGGPGSEADTYLKMVQYNIDTIVNALFNGQRS